MDLKVTDALVTQRVSLNDSLFEIDITTEQPLGDYVPGNFVMLSLDNHLSPFLPRPFSIFDLQDNSLKLIFKEVGKGTKLLANLQLPFPVKVWGPLGNAFPFFKNGLNIVVAGGLGLVPLFHLKRNVAVDSFFVGYKSVREAFLYEEVKDNYNAVISTDDGSLSQKGFITEFFEQYIKENYGKEMNVYTCGPHLFLRQMWELGRRYNIKNIFASFETVMACGFGVCLGCAVETPSGYVKICKKGPVFNINEIFG